MRERRRNVRARILQVGYVLRRIELNGKVVGSPDGWLFRVSPATFVEVTEDTPSGVLEQWFKEQDGELTLCGYTIAELAMISDLFFDGFKLHLDEIADDSTLRRSYIS